VDGPPVVDRLLLLLGDRWFRVAFAQGVGCGPPAPAVLLIEVETRRPWDGLPVESRVPSLGHRCGPGCRCAGLVSRPAWDPLSR
jgi:hypothetical protein